jgi:hypothetical protein
MSECSVRTVGSSPARAGEAARQLIRRLKNPAEQRDNMTDLASHNPVPNSCLASAFGAKGR